MGKIYCDGSTFTKPNEDGILVECVEVTCSQCNNSAWAWGVHDGSVNAALAQLNDTCPRNDNNLYVEGGK